MTDEQDTPESAAPEAPPEPRDKPDKAGGASAPARRSDDAPAWAKELGGKIDRLMESQRAPSDDGEDDGILSVEELPDLVEDAVEGAVETGKELVESIPERVPILFRKLWGNKG